MSTEAPKAQSPLAEAWGMFLRNHAAVAALVVLGLIVLCLVIAGVEYMGWWPEWATSQPRKLRP